MKTLSVLGSTGSIGTQALDVVRAFPDRFRVGALAAHRSWEALAAQALELRPRMVALGDASLAGPLRQRLEGSGVRVAEGLDGLREAASLEGVDLVLSAMVGMAGLIPTLAALESGKPVALANKESLVVGGDLVMDLARRQGLALLPVDSEHSAIFQCLQGEDRGGVRRILLTASGGPFRKVPRDRLAGMRASDALKHPTWDMGAKITIDSASLMNKGLEVIEAQHLFGLRLEQIEVVVHPQSVIHSMVEFADGSVLAQMGPPDMRTPIQYALAYPERLPRVWAPFDPFACGDLTFERPRREDFPCLDLAFQAARAGGTMPAVLNAANEEAVGLFLQDRIGFLQVPAAIQAAMERHRPVVAPRLEDLLEADRWAREAAREAALAPSEA